MLEGPERNTISLERTQRAASVGDADAGRVRRSLLSLMFLLVGKVMNHRRMKLILIILAISSLACQHSIAQQYPSQEQQDWVGSQFFSVLKELSRPHPFPQTSTTDLLLAKLTLDRYDACPGEVLDLQAQVVNMSEVELKVPASPHI